MIDTKRRSIYSLGSMWLSMFLCVGARKRLDMLLGRSRFINALRVCDELPAAF